MSFRTHQGENRKTRRLGLALGFAAAIAVLLTLDGPGITVDEPLDVRPGRTYWATLWSQGLHFFSRPIVDRVFRDNAEHPPLGRWLLGIASVIGEPFEVLWKGPDPTGQYVLSGRLAPALAFAALVRLVTHTGGVRRSAVAGAAAGFALLTMPRVYAHAHLGALDTFLSFFWTWALLAAEKALRSTRAVRDMAGAGAIWALALLVKIHAWLLLPIIVAWSFVRLRPRRALAAVSVWAAAGVILFVIGWPWLWYDFWARLQAYGNTGVLRTPILVQYFGQVFVDRDVPWHYPWFYFAATVPLGFQFLGLVGLVQGWRNRREDAFPLLLAGTVVVFLVLFSTRVPVYDGERLFLNVFPAWALLIGFGFDWLWNQLDSKRYHRIVLLVFAVAQAYGVVSLHPFGLSYYNGAVGGLPGAERLGLELTYWNDSVDQTLLDRLAVLAKPGATAALVPSLYPEQGVLTTNRALARREIVLKDTEEAGRCEWIVLARRTAYWRPQIRERLARGQGELFATRSRQGVWLSALWHFPQQQSVGEKPGERSDR
jgi:4-amino-4-deoxy-L-arabinose transferase-like glycosyltransferase